VNTSITFAMILAALALALALALSACASPPPPVGSAGSNMVSSYDCPEQDPAQPNCKVPR
jgi:starvation-inducible outer membrane lipoprotein